MSESPNDPAEVVLLWRLLWCRWGKEGRFPPRGSVELSGLLRGFSCIKDAHSEYSEAPRVVVKAERKEGSCWSSSTRTSHRFLACLCRMRKRLFRPHFYHRNSLPSSEIVHFIQIKNLLRRAHVYSNLSAFCRHRGLAAARALQVTQLHRLCRTQK